jgi:hypothetical protein
MLAKGLPAASYLDTGNRWVFVDSGDASVFRSGKLEVSATT